MKEQGTKMQLVSWYRLRNKIYISSLQCNGSFAKCQIMRALTAINRNKLILSSVEFTYQTNFLPTIYTFIFIPINHSFLLRPLKCITLMDMTSHWLIETPPIGPKKAWIKSFSISSKQCYIHSIINHKWKHQLIIHCNMTKPHEQAHVTCHVSYVTTLPHVSPDHWISFFSSASFIGISPIWRLITN